MVVTKFWRLNDLVLNLLYYSINGCMYSTCVYVYVLQVESLDEIISVHKEYQSLIYDRCLLNPKVL